MSDSEDAQETQHTDKVERLAALLDEEAAKERLDADYGSQFLAYLQRTRPGITATEVDDMMTAYEALTQGSIH